jgi:hypothetical protein
MEIINPDLLVEIAPNRFANDHLLQSIADASAGLSRSGNPDQYIEHSLRRAFITGCFDKVGCQSFYGSIVRGVIYLSS